MQQLRIVINGHAVLWPWGHDTPALANVTAPWQGFQYLDHASWCEMQVALVTNGRITSSYRTGFREHNYLVLPGRVFIFPGGYAMTHVRSCGAFDTILAELGGPLVNQMLPGRDSLDTHVISPQHNIVETRVGTLLHAMQDEIQAGCPADSLYVESLALALASYIASRFAVRASDPRRDNGRLSKHQRQHLTEFIHNRLESELSLVELALVIRLSPRHFARLFKSTFGVSPHQYVMRERAKRLLVERKTPISEIALSLGFGNQSSFTQTFRRTTGTTPKRYQREH